MVRGSRIRWKGFEWNWVNGGEVGEVVGLVGDLVLKGLVRGVSWDMR